MSKNTKYVVLLATAGRAAINKRRTRKRSAKSSARAHGAKSSHCAQVKALKTMQVPHEEVLLSPKQLMAIREYQSMYDLKRSFFHPWFILLRKIYK